MLKILGGETDLSRRAVIYQVPGLSFREYLQIILSDNFPKFKLDQIIDNHVSISGELVARFKPLQHLSSYLKIGYYPFFLESENSYGIKLNSTINYILENEISGILRSDTKTIQKL